MEPLNIAVANDDNTPTIDVTTPLSPQCLLSPSGPCTQSDLDTDACVEIALVDGQMPCTPDIGPLLKSNRRSAVNTPCQPAISEDTPTFDLATTDDEGCIWKSESVNNLDVNTSGSVETNPTKDFQFQIETEITTNTNSNNSESSPMSGELTINQGDIEINEGSVGDMTFSQDVIQIENAVDDLRSASTKQEGLILSYEVEEEEKVEGQDRDNLTFNADNVEIITEVCKKDDNIASSTFDEVHEVKGEVSLKEFTTEDIEISRNGENVDPAPKIEVVTIVDDNTLTILPEDVKVTSSDVGHETLTFTTGELEISSQIESSSTLNKPSGFAEVNNDNKEDQAESTFKVDQSHQGQKIAISEDEVSEISVVERGNTETSNATAPDEKKAAKITNITPYPGVYFTYDPITWAYKAAEHWYDRFVSPSTTHATTHAMTNATTNALVDALYCTRMLLAAGFVVLSSKVNIDGKEKILTRCANTRLAGVGVAGVGLAGVDEASSNAARGAVDIQRLVESLKCRMVNSSITNTGSSRVQTETRSKVTTDVISKVTQQRIPAQTVMYGVKQHTPLQNTSPQHTPYQRPHYTPQQVPGVQPTMPYTNMNVQKPVYQGEYKPSTATNFTKPEVKIFKPEMNKFKPDTRESTTSYPFAMSQPKPKQGHLKYIGSRY